MLVTIQINRVLVTYVYDAVALEQMVLVVRGLAPAAKVHGTLAAVEIGLLDTPAKYADVTSLGRVVRQGYLPVPGSAVDVILPRQMAIFRCRKCASTGGADQPTGRGMRAHLVLRRPAAARTRIREELTVVEVEAVFAEGVATGERDRIDRGFEADEALEMVVVFGQLSIGGAGTRFSNGKTRHSCIQRCCCSKTMLRCCFMIDRDCCSCF